MAIVDDRYQQAIAYVHRAVDAVEQLPSFLNPIDRYAATVKTQPVRNELARVEASWRPGASEDERARVARAAELLADRTKESLPGAPQDWRRTNLYAGERETSTAATTYRAELESEAAADWHWLKAGAADALHVGGDAGKWLLAGAAVVLGIKAFDYFGQLEANRGSRVGGADAGLRRRLDGALVDAAYAGAHNAESRNDDDGPSVADERPRRAPVRQARSKGAARARKRAARAR